MAYDADLANRVREQFAEQDARTEVRMFGGLAFLVHGNMAVAVTHDDLMVRVGADAVEEALEEADRGTERLAYLERRIGDLREGIADQDRATPPPNLPPGARPRRRRFLR
jgi:hypothetical protein